LSPVLFYVYTDGMVIFLYGKDSLRRGRKLKELTSSYKAKHKETDVMEFDLSSDLEEWRGAKDFLNQPSMFVESKIAIIRSSTIPCEKEWVEETKKQVFSKKTFLIISTDEKPEKDFLFLLKSPVVSQKFDELSGVSLSKFFDEEAEALKISFFPEAKKFILSYISLKEEARTWSLVGELTKLSLLFGGKKIEKRDVEKLFDAREKERVFQLSGRVFSSRTPKDALPLIELLLLQKEDPAYIFNSLAYKATGKSALVFANYDVLIKGGKLGYEEVLLDFSINAGKL